jgi:hypothetical protein
VLQAKDENELKVQLPRLAAFMPRPREVKSRQLAERIGVFLKEMSSSR